MAFKTNRPPILSLSPSAASTWMACTAQPGFLLANAHLIKDTDTVWNVEGTKAHEIANLVMLDKPIPKDTPLAMRRHAQGFKDHCLSTKPTKFATEQKVSLWYMPARNGYIDFVGFHPDLLRIEDLKYGQGVAVDAFENEQLIIYLRSLVEHQQIKLKSSTRTRMGIYQPRVREGEPITEWEISWEEVMDFTAPITETAKKIIADPMSKKLKFAPSPETCRWCALKEHCPARAEAAVGQVKDLRPLLADQPPEVLVLPSTRTLSAEQKAFVVIYRSRIKKWLDDIYEDERRNAILGNMLPGTKLVAGKGGSVWHNTSAVEKLLLKVLPQNTVTPSKLLSPHQAKLALTEIQAPGFIQDMVAFLTDKVKGKPTLVPVSDKRPSLGKVDPNDVFEAIEDEDDD